MGRTKIALFMAIILASGCACAEQYAFRTSHEGKLIEYREKHIVKTGKWTDEISKVAAWYGNALPYLNLDYVNLDAKTSKYGCKMVGKPTSTEAPRVSIDLDYLDENDGGRYAIYVDYPENYTCNPTSMEIDDALAEKIRKTKIQIAEAEKQNSNYKPEPEARKEVVIGRYAATRDNIRVGVLLACQNGASDSNDWFVDERASRIKRLLALYEGDSQSVKRINNAYSFARRNLSDRYPLDTRGRYRDAVCEQMILKGKL